MERRIPIRRHRPAGIVQPVPGLWGLGGIFLSPSGSPPGYFLRAMRRGRRIGIRLSIAMTGHRDALATMERELHGFRLYRAIYGAVAPPWRGRHGAHFAAPLVLRLAADRNPPFHSNDRASWRPRHDEARAPRFSPLSGHLWRCRATVARAPRSPFCGALGLGVGGGLESAFP